MKFFLRRASNHLRGCLSRYTESVNVSNSCLSAEVHCESAAAEDSSLQNWTVSKTLCAPLLCAGSSPAGCSPQLITQGWPLGLGDHLGAPGNSPSSPDGLGVTLHPGKAAWWYQGPTALPWERPGMGQKWEVIAFKGPRVLHLEPVGISAWPQPFHPPPRSLGEARDSQGGVILLSLLLPSTLLSLT